MRRFVAWAAALAMGVVLLTGACRPPEHVLALVGGQPIDIEVFQRYLGAVTGEAWEVVDHRVASRLLDQFLDQEVVAQAARRRHEASVPVDPNRRSAMVRRLLDTLCGDVPPLPDEEVEQEVARRLEVVRPARAHVRQLLVSDRDQAKAVRQRLAAGEDFLAVSSELSSAANAKAGGELGMIVQGTLPPEMDEVIFRLDVGEVSEPVEGQSGYHLFQVRELIPEGRPSREQVEPQVRRELAETHARAFTRQCVARLSHEVGVRVFPDHLWFEYEGKYVEEQDAAQESLGAGSDARAAGRHGEGGRAGGPGGDPDQGQRPDRDHVGLQDPSAPGAVTTP
jgi:hypothetical protein